jgi:serine/threonine protein kinase
LEAKMTPERFRQIRNLFEAALEKAPEERMILVDRASQGDEPLRQEVRRMLVAHQQTLSFLDGAVAAPPELRTDPGRMEGRRLGPFEILRELGRGGMGTVYLARRADELFHQQVAIKIVTPESAGPEVIQRFYQEREILASLQHPNIARIYDGGSTEEGWPYFVMEYVEGQPIDVWCDQRKLNVSERLRLFQTICAAVHYAHQHRVVHRDLKPGNILVTEEGLVKLLDFGIAKLVRAGEDRKALLTRDGMRLMTPEYASPEQMRAEETTPLTDVYALGVILYELLTGRGPYGLKSRIFHEIMRVVCEEPPQRPSTAVMEPGGRMTQDGKTLSIAPGVLSHPREGTPVDLKRRLAGDLDNVLLKSLEKDPLLRYRSVEQFRMDLERHLNGQTVLARKNTWWTRVGRLTGRHKIAIALGSGILIAIVTGGVRVTWSGLAYLAGVMALLVLWHAATDREIGSKIAENFYGMPMLVVVVLFALVMLLVGLSLRFPVPVRWLGEPWLLSGVMLAAGGYFWTLVAGWFFRRRWAGDLLLKVKVKLADPLGVVLLINTVNIAVSTLHLFRHASRADPVRLISIAVLFTVTLCAFVTAQRLEFRERGLVLRGRLIPWVNIEDYTWEGVNEPWALVTLLAKPEKEVLRLNTRRLFRLLPPPRIPIPQERQEEVEAVMKRHLSAWPE